ncbi:hypothetical protein BCA37_02975 [Mycobacterium sp. djl-10]|nr:hypothetical protein BCA37_02975 [Mycobacterium sp. djl-10]
MRTILPTSRRPKGASSGRAAVATVAAAVLGVGATLYPGDVPSLIGFPPTGRGEQHLETLSPSVYATPRRADITLLRRSDLTELPSDTATLKIETELVELAGIYGSPELVRSLEVMRSIEVALQSHQQVFAGGGGGGQGAAPFGDTFLEFVVLVENFLKSMAGASGPELVEMLSNVLPTVMRRLEILIGPPHTSAPAAGAAPLVAPPPPTIQPTSPQTPAPRIADLQPPTLAPSDAPAEPAADAPAPVSESSTPTTASVSPASPAPDITMVVDPPPIQTNPEPSPSAAPPSDEPTTEPQPEPQQDDDPGSSNYSTGPDQPTTAGQTSANVNDLESDSISTSNSDNSSNDNSDNEQSPAQGNNASNG